MQLPIALNDVNFQQYYFKKKNKHICEIVFTRVHILWIEIIGCREKRSAHVIFKTQDTPFTCAMSFIPTSLTHFMHFII